MVKRHILFIGVQKRGIQENILLHFEVALKWRGYKNILGDKI